MSQATQSPEWDATISLDEMLGQAKFFVLVRGQTELAKVVHTEVNLLGKVRYDYYGLSHDRYGVTYDGDGSIDAEFIGHLITNRGYDLTTDKESVLRWIYDVMNPVLARTP